jgi:phosphatidylglycerophosphatase A
VSGIHARDCRDIRVLLATGCGSGFAPRAPGTAGSAVALAIWWFALAPLDLPVAAACVAVLSIVGIAVVDAACRRTGVADDPRIVLDEWLGLWVALLGCPKAALPALGGFALFRFFDIVKPWPVSWADRRVGGGLGVVLDDLLAGGLAAVVLQISLALLGAPPG